MVEITTEAATAIIEGLQARNKALERKVAHLEHVLQQRVILTENLYQKNKDRFENLEKIVYAIFRENSGISFTYAELQEECRYRYPNVPWANLERRVRALRQKGLLWSDVDPETKKVRFWQKLEVLP